MTFGQTFKLPMNERESSPAGEIGVDGADDDRKTAVDCTAAGRPQAGTVRSAAQARSAAILSARVTDMGNVWLNAASRSASVTVAARAPAR